MRALTHLVAADDGTVITRTETLVRVASTVTVDRHLLDDAHAVERVLHELRSDLHRRMARLGRLPVGEATTYWHEVPMMDRRICHAEVLTRESDQGEWPSVWAAVHEDGWL
jgi:hypothetical protein